MLQVPNWILPLPGHQNVLICCAGVAYLLRVKINYSLSKLYTLSKLTLPKLYTSISQPFRVGGAPSSSTNYFQFGFYVRTGFVLGLGEPVLYHRDNWVQNWPQTDRQYPWTESVVSKTKALKKCLGTPCFNMSQACFPHWQQYCLTHEIRGIDYTNYVWSKSVNFQIVFSNENIVIFCCKMSH